MGTIKILAEIKTIVEDKGYDSIKEWLIKETRKNVYSKLRCDITYGLKDWMGGSIKTIIRRSNVYTLDDVVLGSDNPDNVTGILTEHEDNLKNLLHGYLSIIMKGTGDFEAAVVKMETLRYESPETYEKMKKNAPVNYDTAFYGLRNLMGIMDNVYVPGTELIVAEYKKDDIPEFSTRGSKDIEERIRKNPEDWALLRVYY